LKEIKETLAGVKGQEAVALCDAADRLQTLRKADLVTCWVTSGGLHYASYDGATGQLRLHIDHAKMGLDT
jgi:hypothetical protein